MNALKPFALSVLFAAAVIGGAAQAFVTGSRSQPISAALPLVHTDANGRAIDGYDPVAYFTKDEALFGNRSISYRWRGAEWLFVSEEHRRAFIADPQRYAPQYGGYCAYGISQGFAVAAHPEAWLIVDGKLYLNKRHARWRWREDLSELSELAKLHWEMAGGWLGVRLAGP